MVQPASFHQRAEDRQPALLLPGGEVQIGDLCRGLFQTPDSRLALENTGLVLVAIQVAAPLQPGQGGSHPGVAVKLIRIDIDHIEAQQVAGRQHHGVLTPRDVADTAEELADLPLVEHRLATQAKLALDILFVEDQDALCGIAVPAGPTGLLQIILQRGWNIGVDDEPHILLVDPHAEGVGRADDRGGAGDETVLDTFLQRRLQTGVEGFCRVAMCLEQFGQPFGVLSPGTIDDYAALAIVAAAKQVENRLVLLVTGDLLDLVVQIDALVPSGELPHLQTQFAQDDIDDLRFDIFFRRGSEALDRRDADVFPFGEFADEADRIEIVGAEVVAPFRQAVRLVKDPGADLPLADGGAEGRIAQLLRRNQQDADIAEADAFQIPPRAPAWSACRRERRPSWCRSAGRNCRPGPSSAPAAAR